MQGLLKRAPRQESGGFIPMRVMWCWRCKMDIPMLEPEESQRIGDLLRNGVRMISHEEIDRILIGDGNPERLRPWSEEEVNRQAALNEYQRITGFRETNPNALWHHQVELYGPPCKACGKPLRTPDAKLCGSCMNRA
jgi:hypothetical protein